MYATFWDSSFMFSWAFFFNIVAFALKSYIA